MRAESGEPGEGGIGRAGAGERARHGVDDARMARRDGRNGSDVRLILGVVASGFGAIGEKSVARYVARAGLLATA